MRARRAGTTFTIALSGPARFTLTFTEPDAGRSAGRRCAAPSKHNRHKRHCTLIAGKLTVSGHAGNNTIKFDGRVSGRKTLKAGRYAVVVSVAGSSATKTLNFVIVR